MNNQKNIQIAIERIDNVRKNKLLHLDLCGLLLQELPCDISDLTFLLDVDMSYNQLNTIPKSICDLPHLLYLNVSNNNITHIDFDPIRQHTIKELDISNNCLYLLPESVGYLNGNSEIIFENNPFLDRLPSEIEYQDFWHVQYYIELLSQQKEINGIYETKLIFVGSGEVGKTTLIKVLKDENHFVELGAEPTTHGIQIESLSYDILFPACNPYYNTYKDITKVYVLDEEIDTDELSLTVEDVPVLDQEYYVPLSSILDEYEEETIAELMISSDITRTFFKAAIKKTVKINLWDFGGQEIYYSTHQFFLTKRSVYIFVWDPRKDDDDADFEYWLNTIALLSSDSPIIIVMNKCDIRLKNIDVTYYRNKFRNIVAFKSISCLTKDGLPELKDEIKKCIRELPHIGDKIPNTWTRVREKISAMSNDYFSYSDFANVCFDNNQIKNPEELSLFSDYLHDIGDIIHFKDDPTLRNLVIVNPQWATKAVYALIDTIPIQKKDGIFSIYDLEDYWDSKAYPRERHLELLQLMEKFEICFKLVGAKDIYVIPELLKTEISDATPLTEIDSAETLKFQIYYDFMPHGIITRLICRLFNMIYMDFYWKNGFVLQSEMAIGYVLSDRAKKTITISISGKQRGNLLAIIRNEFKDIHKAFNMRDADFEEMIPCPCDTCSISSNPYFFKYNVLKNFISKEKTSIDCHASADSIDIIKLVSGYTFTKRRKKLIYNILSAVSQLQGHNHIIIKDEDARNSFISQLLSNSGIFSKDQTRWGKSGSGASQGRLDIKIEDGKGTILTVFEGLNLINVDSAKIDSHIRKTLGNYDPNGLYEKYLCVYYDGGNFESFCDRYFAYVNIEKPAFKFTSTIDESQMLVQQTEIKVFKSAYERTSREVYLYHILVNLT